jgi:hypothetical protein
MTHNQGKAANPQTAEGEVGQIHSVWRYLAEPSSLTSNEATLRRKKLIAASSLIPLDKKAV